MRNKEKHIRAEKCNSCRGSGRVTYRIITGFTEPLFGFGSSSISIGEPIYGNKNQGTCPNCRGTGYQIRNIPCPLCNKTGKVVNLKRSKNFRCPLCLGVKVISKQYKSKLIDTYRHKQKAKRLNLSFREYLRNRYIK